MKFCLKSLGEFPMCYEPIPNSFICLRCLKKPHFSSPTSHYPSLFPLPQSIPHTNVWSHPDVWCPLTRASFLLLDFSYSAFWQDHPTDLLILFRIFLFKVLFFFFFLLNVAWFICSSSANGQVSLYYPGCLMLYSVLIQFLDGLFLKYGCTVRSRLLDDWSERREWIKMERSISLIHICHPPSASHTVHCSQEEVL